jgi:hypothetical protein
VLGQSFQQVSRTYQIDIIKRTGITVVNIRDTCQVDYCVWFELRNLGCDSYRIGQIGI